MTDVADLLMESYRKTKTEGNDFRELSPAIDETSPLSPHEITSKFRDLLLEGNKTEALGIFICFELVYEIYCSYIHTSMFAYNLFLKALETLPPPISKNSFQII